MCAEDAAPATAPAPTPVADVLLMDAMEALRNDDIDLAIATMSKARAQTEQDRNAPIGQRQGEQRDPLGRPLSQGGNVETNERLVPTEDQYRRSREVMDEIRKRSGDRSRPMIELDYLRRLLDRF